VKQRFTLDRESFEQFLAAVSLFQSLQRTAVNGSGAPSPPLLQHSLETLRAIDSGTLDLQSAMDRVAGLALQIVGGDGAVVWLFTTEELVCHATVGSHFDDDRVRTALRLRLQSAGAFGANSPATLDLTRTLENFAGALGSALAVALLPGGKMAGAVAVFADPSRTFTERNYANLRLLAGFAQYVLTKWIATQEQDSLSDSTEADRARNALLALHSSSNQRSPTAPFVPRLPSPALSQSKLSTAPDRGIDTQDALAWSKNEVRPTTDPTQSVSPSATHEILDVNSPLDSPAKPSSAEPSKYPKDDRTRTAINAAHQIMHRLNAAASGAKEILIAQRSRFQHRSGRRMSFGLSWRVVRQAVPAFVILAVMSFFAGLLTGGRQPLSVGPINPVAEASAAPLATHAAHDLHEKADTILAAKKSPVVPAETSHLQITDREAAATIAELSKYEVRTLRLAAEYGDDQAALELGMLYELGRGFPQSCNKAAQWVSKSAQEGNPAAEYNLGLRYRDGDGLAPDTQQAEIWLRKAAAHKNANAKRVLAELSPSAGPTPTQAAR
jgi:hypothetical protein